MKPEEIMELEKKFIMQTFSRPSIVIEKGEGCYVFDKSNKKYLDLIGGLATAPIGHGNEDLVKVLSEQAKKIINITNLY